jgi:hypothetical protein
VSAEIGAGALSAFGANETMRPGKRVLGMSANDPCRTLAFTIAALRLAPEPHFADRKSLL